MNKPKKEPPLPRGQAGAPKPSSLNSSSSACLFSGSSLSSSSSSAHVQKRLLVTSSSPGVTYIDVSTYDAAAHMHNSLERAAPGHTGFRPVEFLGHHFLQHYILPHVSSSLVSFCKRGRRWNCNCHILGMNGAQGPMHTDEIYPLSFSPFPGTLESQMCMRIGVFIIYKTWVRYRSLILVFILNLFFIVRMINYLISLFQRILNKISINFYWQKRLSMGRYCLKYIIH